MKVLLANPHGFCAGVVMAVRKDSTRNTGRPLEPLRRPPHRSRDHFGQKLISRPFEAAMAFCTYANDCR